MSDPIKQLNREIAQLKQKVREREAIIDSLRKQLAQARQTGWGPTSIHEVF